MIAAGLLYVDLRSAPLTEPSRIHVSTSKAARKASDKRPAWRGYDLSIALARQLVSASVAGGSDIY